MNQPKPPPERPPRSIPALSRGLRAVRLLAAAGDAGIGFTDLGRQLDALPAPTLSRLLKALVAEGYAAKTEAGLYAHGPALVELGRALGAGGTLEELALEAMNAFARETGESIAFARFYGDRLVLAAKVEVADSFKLAPHGCAFRPAPWEGPAVAVAAHLAGEDFDRFVNAPPGLAGALADFRKQTAACLREGVRVEPMPNRPARGAPRRACAAVLDAAGRPVGELHTVCPAEHFAREGRKLTASLLRAAESMAARLVAGGK